MIKEEPNGIEIIFEKKYTEEKKIVKANIKNLSNLINNLWSLNKPEKIKIYITDSYIKYCISIYSIGEMFILLIIFPYWFIRARHYFKDIGAIDINTKNPSILIKSMDFFKGAKVGIGRLIYKKSKSIQEKYKHGFVTLVVSIKLHEIKCPKWLGSGIGSLTSEKFLARNIIKKETIEILDTHSKEEFNNTTGAYPHVVGYWTVRYFEENYPGFLKETFKKYKGEEIVEQIILKLGLDSDNYWEQLDELLYKNYKHLLEK